jgi:hypothetical protein
LVATAQGSAGEYLRTVGESILDKSLFNEETDPEVVKETLTKSFEQYNSAVSELTSFLEDKPEYDAGAETVSDLGPVGLEE